VAGEEGCTCGGQSQKRRNHMCRADHTKVSVQYFRTCTRVSVETVVYVRRFQWKQSCIYVGLSGYIHIHA
jgi:hypothetical protein